MNNRPENPAACIQYIYSLYTLTNKTVEEIATYFKMSVEQIHEVVFYVRASNK